VLVPRWIVAFGTRRERYESAYEMPCYRGIAPVKEASRKTSWVHFRRACGKFLRQTFHQFGLHSIGPSEWAKAYYQHLGEDENQSHGGGPKLGVPVDSHHLSMLEGRQAV
jgi:hypothetical protein